MAISLHRCGVLSAALLLALLLSACGRRDGDDGARAEAEALAPLSADFEGAWQGVLPCVDCEGLDVELELRREDGGGARYRLHEHYLGREEAGAFVAEGEWREESCRFGAETGACIVLVESGQRWFRRIDGALQAIDDEGRALDPEGARLLRR